MFSQNQSVPHPASLFGGQTDSATPWARGRSTGTRYTRRRVIRSVRVGEMRPVTSGGTTPTRIETQTGED
jgi:hypothetical protein